MAKAFKSSFENVAEGFCASEEEFRVGVMKRAAWFCKKYANKKNPRAFDLPKNKNFTANIYDANKMELDGDIQKIIIKNLPVLHRFIYIFYTVCDCSKDEISKLFHMNESTAENALESINGNIGKIVSAVSEKTKMKISMDEEKFRDWLLSSSAATEVPKSIDMTVLMCIDSICAHYTDALPMTCFVHTVYALPLHCPRGLFLLKYSFH